MKKLNIFKIIFFVLIISSCSPENQDFTVLNNDDIKISDLLNEPNLGVITYDNKTSIIKNNNEIIQFKNGKINYNLIFENVSEIQIIESKSSNDEI